MRFFQTLHTQKSKYTFILLRAIVIAGLIALPYYLFYPQHFIGGDDTRIFTVFPRLFLDAIAPYSWFHLSSMGSNNPNQFFIPILVIIYVAQLAIRSVTVVSYLYFSLPLLLGFIYFEKLASELLRNTTKAEPYIGALMYISSPILIVTQWSVFLTTVWLIGLMPALGFYYIRYVVLKQTKALYIACILSFLLSVGFFAIPWILGYLIPLLVGVGVLILFGSRQIRSLDFWKRSVVFVACITITNSFWLVPFFQATLSPSPNSIGSSVVSQDIKNTFVTTVNATAVGTVVYPLLNLFHHQIAHNFHWSQLSVFTKYYDRLAWLNVAFPIVLLFGIYKSKRSFTPSQRAVFLAITTSYVVSLYFFTINIGVLKNIFILLGEIPGWVIFRNSFDKFAPGYVFFFSLLLTYGLVTIRNSFAKYRIFMLIIVTIILLNSVPFKKLVNHSLWTTTSVKTNAIIPSEYKDFMATVREKVPPTSNILSLPLKNPGYGIIPIPNSTHAYVGQSLVGIFANRYDMAGFLSFPQTYAQLIRDRILQHDYAKLITIFQQLNIDYVLTTEHIPNELQKSYLFDQEILAIEQRPEFSEALQGEMLAESSNGNFRLYRLKNTPVNSLMSVPQDIYISSSNPMLSEKTLPFIGNASVITSSDNAPIRAVGKGIDFPTINTPLYLFPGEYTLKRDPGISNIINFNPKKHTIEQTSDLNYSLNSEQPPYERRWKTILEHIEENDLISIHDQLLQARDISETPVNEGDTVQVFSKAEGNILPTSEEIVQQWSQGNCNAITAEPSTHVSYADNTITLQSKKQHDACIYHTVPLNDAATYTLEFDYRGTGKGRAVYIDISEKNKITYPLPASTEWEHAVISFDTEKSGSAQLYFYSGSAEGTSTRELKNIQLHSPEEREKVTIEPIQETAIAFTVTQPTTFSLPVPDHSAALPLVENWSRGDCEAVDAKQAISFFPINTNGMRLEATDGHNACIYTKVPLNSNMGYTLTFDAYSSNQDTASVFIEFNNEAKPIVRTIPLSQNVWHNSDIDISKPPGADTATIYLYSGKASSGVSETTYANIKLASHPAVYNTITLHREPDTKYIVPENTVATIAKYSPVAYVAHIEHAPTEFLIQFKEAFNTGWNIYPGKAYRWYTPLISKPIAIDHYSLNGSTSNGWLLRTKELCESTNCVGNPNDYSADFLIIFTPQRWFYIGSAITALFLTVLTLYIAYRYYPKKHVPSNL